MEGITKIQAIATGQCPKCRKGDIFEYKWWQIQHFSKMNTNCPVCNVKFEVEPGFFFGAMYMSYGFTIMIMAIGGYLIYNLFGDPPAIFYILPITIFSLLFTPFNFRISRVLYIYTMSGINYLPSIK